MNSCLISSAFLIEPFQVMCRAQKNSVHNYMYVPLLQTRLFLKLVPTIMKLLILHLIFLHECSIFGTAKPSHLKIEGK